MITYNHAAYISQAIEGVLSQNTDFSFELVIGEDCSKDRTRDIALSYEKRFPHKIRVITSDTNVGMHANSDRTHAACRGEYIAFCEGDDCWHDQAKLQRQVDFLNTHPEYVLAHSNCDLLYVQSGERVRNYLRFPNDLDDGKAYEEILTRKRNVQTLTVLARKAVVDRVLREAPECTDSRFLMRDLQLWLEISRHGNLKFFSESFATHNMLVESATHSQNPKKELRFALSARDLVYHYVAKYPCSERAANEAKSSATLFTLIKASKSGDSSLARELYCEHRTLRARISPHAMLLLLGSHSKIAHSMTEALGAAYFGVRRFLPTGPDVAADSTAASKR
jgi:glycosyltransferase involved in cell wall biosynthesis